MAQTLDRMLVNAALYRVESGMPLLPGDALVLARALREVEDLLASAPRATPGPKPRAKTYPGEWLLGNPDRNPRYVKTGEFRCPKRGEFYLSGAVPQAYRAHGDLGTAYDIMRPATQSEAKCRECGRLV